MSQKNAEKFFNKVQTQEAFSKEFYTLLLSCKGLSQDEALEKVVVFAHKQNYDFTSQDIKLFAKGKESDELNEEELDAVTGGGFGAGFVVTSVGGTQICTVVGYKT